ncbi:SWIRM-domain-containing protein [Hyphopichia burtonii NRRL Y-1933]|uniref:SWIRM-domain-containing protein n=1 Tax=Hyphopichia burtonii NRRL Y-1933 TaxID=984485 RepID=A0A1E4RE10_9ASCO|nr:SWIRM-domain-containing protein [Hyphopichia burtonii NRRL Y-1933]ODV65504.1 SWIRM-domain-containing protein [Hyphopichia burtonii NRRL Y-1933]
MDVDSKKEDFKKKTRIRQTHSIIIPSYSSWFNMKKIHQIERESLPEFFATNHPSKSPKIYANYRNFMINSYRLNPNEYLTLTSCRRNLVGDVGTLMRVHRFLNKWGLINYQVNPQLKPGYAIEKLPNGSSVGLPYTGDYHVQYDTPRGLFPFDTFKPSMDNLDIAKLKNLIKPESNQSTQLQSPPQEKSKLTHSIDDNNDADDHLNKKRKFLNDGWNDEEMKKLVLSIKQHPNDWYKISKNVGTKTPQECILKFLQLPIEDGFGNLNEKDYGILKFASNFPVNAVDNPVINNLTFLTQIVDSDVAKAATKAASKVIDDSIFSKIKEIYGDENLEAESKAKDITSPKENGDAINQDDKPENQDESKAEDDKIKIDEQRKSDDKPEEERLETEKEEEKEKEQEKEQEKPRADSKQEEKPDILKDSSAATFGLVGARSHLFANYEEREMHRLTSTLINNELSKIDIKLQKVAELERVYEREKKQLARQQEEVFIDRLALAKSTINITKKLSNAVSLIQNSDSPGLENVSGILQEVQSLLYKPTSHGLYTNESNNTPENGSDNNKNNGTTETNKNNNAIPLSLEAPQSFKVWAP